MREVIYIESARRHVGSDKKLGDMVAKFLHRQVALRLRKIAVETIGVVAVGYKIVGYLLGLLLGAAEDYAVNVGIIVSHTFQREILVVRLHHVVDMLHIGGTLVFIACHKFHRVVHEFAGDRGDLFRHGGGKHQHLALLRHMGKNLVDVVDKAHIEHLVGLVEHHGVDMVEFYHSLLMRSISRPGVATITCTPFRIPLICDSMLLPP